MCIRIELPLIIIIILILIILVYSVTFLEPKNNNIKASSIDTIENFASPVIIPPTTQKIVQAAVYAEAFSRPSIPNELKLNLIIDPTSSNIDPKTRKQYNRLLVPIHLITTMDNKYLAVFNDGKLYSKNNLIDDTLWIGPLKNSLFGSQEIGIGMRMVMFFPLIVNQERQIRLFGIGADNLLYYKETESLASKWLQSPGQEQLVYLFCDYYETNIKYPLLYAINSLGEIVYKNANGQPPEDTIEEKDFIALPFSSPNPPIINNIKILKVFWDRNGFMIGISTDFKIYQKKGIDWKIRPWENSVQVRGKNPGSSATVIDMLMDNDSRMIGLVLDQDKVKPMIKIQKQDQPYYLADFESLNDSKPDKKMYTNYQMIKYKTGFDWEVFLNFEDLDEYLYRTNNLQAIYQRSIMNDKIKLKKICKDRAPVTNTEARNFDLERAITEKDTKINTLNKELEGLLRFGSVKMEKTFDPVVTPTPTPNSSK
jgi:hypothetical protein